jgi:hypothetical protein
MDTMDTRTAEQGPAVDVQARLNEIKAHMPMTYREIQDKAKAIGNDAFRYVRHGVSGQANKFYAVERGRVVGTPFDLPGVSDEVARIVVQFGCEFLIMWAPEAQKGKADGTH